MGYVRVNGLIGRSEVESTDVTFLVDTGAFYSAIPPRLADGLNLKASLDSELTLADKRRVKAGITLAYLSTRDHMDSR
ncbi:MAG: aspartyl protease family protein [Candidatus Nezhaarchaeales archaeon]